jgi:hypothetical protein
MTYRGGAVDLDATIEATKPLLDAGVTDFRATFRFTGDFDADKAMVSDVVNAFAKAFRAQPEPGEVAVG